MLGKIYTKGKGAYSLYVTAFCINFNDAENQLCFNYSDLKASIGLSLEALYAGNIPNTIPINKLDRKDIAIIIDLISKLNPNVCKISPIATPKTTPITPPSIHKISASIKNCTKISFLFAPKSFSNSYFLRPFCN